MQRIALIDYGSGNLRSAEKALIEAAHRRGLDAQVLVTHEPEAIASADRLVLPGVGAFGACMAHLQENDGLIEAMSEAVLQRGAPFLGVCVGMQLLASRGLEFGETAGLGWIPGDVARLTPSSDHFKVPHMGWNSLTGLSPHPLFGGLGAAPEMYFTHSFAFQPADSLYTAATADHGGAFAAAVARDNVLGVQFHPEKSQTAGLELLGNFLEWTA